MSECAHILVYCLIHFLYNIGIYLEVYVYVVSYRLHVLANTEDNSDTGELELIRHLHVNVSSLKILLQGTIFVMT